MIYFTADLRFYHDKVIQHVNRPFPNAEKMNQVLIENWNRKVGAADEVYILGDVTMKGASYATEALSRLKGRKYLVKGNHDRFAEQKEFDKYIFEWIKDYHELKYQNNEFILFHYPIEEWKGFYRGAFHLHGHQHNHADYNYRNLEQGIRRYDVGVDANNMCPVSIEEILEFFAMGEELRQ